MSENLQSDNHFLGLINYLGAAIGSADESYKSKYVDLELFFLDALAHKDKSSRIMETFLCWCLEYGHLLSPSKIRRMLKDHPVDPRLLGGMISFFTSHNIKKEQWKILKPFTKKGKRSISFGGVRVRSPEPNFEKYGILIPNFELDKNKFLRPKEWTLKHCPEIRNRMLFGSVIHSDIASYLAKNPDANAYRTSLEIEHDKSNIFKNFNDVKVSLAAAS